MVLLLGGWRPSVCRGPHVLTCIILVNLCVTPCYSKTGSTTSSLSSLWRARLEVTAECCSTPSSSRSHDTYTDLSR